MQIIKKDGTLEQYDEQKIINACNKAARRAMVELLDKDYQIICNAVWSKLVENDLEVDEDEKVIVALIASIVAGEGIDEPNLHIKRITRIS